jgi:NitT/TauT family transport system substrate-binding protein
MQLSYVQTGMAAAQMLGAGRASVAILSEPAATAAIMMGSQQGHVLHRSISLQDVWVKHHGGTGIPMVGVAVHASLLEDAPEIIAALRPGLPEARAWVFAHRGEAAALADKMMQMQPQVFAMALDHFNIDVVSARATKDALTAFYQIILDLAPNALGGKLPPDDYYLDL